MNNPPSSISSQSTARVSSPGGTLLWNVSPGTAGIDPSGRSTRFGEQMRKCAKSSSSKAPKGKAANAAQGPSKPETSSSKAQPPVYKMDSRVFASPYRFPSVDQMKNQRKDAKSDDDDSDGGMIIGPTESKEAHPLIPTSMPRITLKKGKPNSVTSSSSLDSSKSMRSIGEWDNLMEDSTSSPPSTSSAGPEGQGVAVGVNTGQLPGVERCTARKNEDPNMA